MGTRLASGLGLAKTALWVPDALPASPTAYDYEFGAEGTSVPSGWSWMNQGTATYQEANGTGYVLHDGGGSNLRGIVQPIPGDSTFEFRAKFRFVSLWNFNYLFCGFFLHDNAGSKVAGAGYDNRGTSWAYWSDFTTFGGSENGDKRLLMLGDTLYMSLKKNSATSWDIAYSTNGSVYSTIHAAVNLGAWFTPNRIGWGIQQQTSTGSTKQPFGCEWFRRVA